MKAKKLILVLFGLVLSLIILEVALRAVGHVVWNSSGKSMSVQDKKGLRIICLGDSFTYGLGVERGEDFPAQLAELMKNDVSGLEVINCGQPGLNTPLLAKKTIALLDKYKPDIVLVLVGANDLWNYEGMEELSDFSSSWRISKLYTIIKSGFSLPDSSARGVEKNLDIIKRMGGYNKLYLRQLILIGNNYRDEGDYEQSKLCYDAAMKIDAGYNPLLREILRLYTRMLENQDGDRSIDEFSILNQGIENIDFENGDLSKETRELYLVLCLRGNDYRLKNEFKKADECYRLANKVMKNDFAVYSESIRLLNELLTERSGSATYSEPFIRKNACIRALISNWQLIGNKEELFEDLVALNRYGKGMFATADRILLLALIHELYGDRIKIYEEMDDLFVSIDDPSLAIEFYEWMIKRYPGNLNVNLRLGRQYKRVRDFKRSRIYYAKVLEKEPGNQESIEGIAAADIFIAQGLSEHFFALEKKLSLYENLPDVFYDDNQSGEVSGKSSRDENTIHSINKDKRKSITADKLKLISRLCRIKNANLLFVSYPLELMDEMVCVANEEHVPLIDLRRRFSTEIEREDLTRYFQPDGHCTAKGNRIIAEVIAEYLKEFLALDYN